MGMSPNTTSLSISGDHAAPLEAVLKAALAAGATDAVASISEGEGLTVGTRLGKLESCEQSGSTSLGLRVYIGQRSASVSTNDLRQLDAANLAQRAVTIARASTGDEYAGLASADQLARETYPVDTSDESFALDMAALQARAEAGEGAALATAGITNSEGASAWANRSRYSMASTVGFMASETSTVQGLSVTAIAADRDGGMVVDSDYASAIYLSDLPDPESIGRKAALKALRQCNSEKIATMNDVSVIFEADAARSLLGHFLGSISGGAVALGQSFLVDSLGRQIFAPQITILDEPQLPRGLRSRSFDSDGLPTRPLPLVQEGILRNYLLSLRSARQLKLAPNGRASGASNVSISAGKLSVPELLRDIRRGIYITDVMGPGVNTVTGDYSRGLAGLVIEDGELAGAVSEVTIAGTLQQIFARMTAASDLVRKSGVDSPSLRVDGLTLAGR